MSASATQGGHNKWLDNSKAVAILDECRRR